MEKIHIFSQYQIKSAKGRLLSLRSLAQILPVLLLGRVVVFGSAAPFGLAYLAAYTAAKRAPSWRYVAVAFLGFISVTTSGADVFAIKYLLSFVLFGLIYVSVTTLTDSRKQMTVPPMAGLALLISGVIFSAQTGFVFYDMAMLGVECVLCVLSAHLLKEGIPRLEADPSRRAQSAGEPGIYTLLILCVMGLSGIRIGPLHLGNAMAVTIILLLAHTGGITGGCAGGVGMGIIYGLSRFPLTDMIGVYSFCGLAAGALRRFHKAGLLLGFFLANSILSVYLGGFDSGVFHVFEMLLGMAVFCAIPKSAVFELEGLVRGKTQVSTEATVLMIRKRLQAASAAFSRLSQTFADAVRPERRENLADVAVLFDRTADKVCKRCGLKFHCWERQFHSTYDSLMKLAPSMGSQEELAASPLGELFRGRCIKSVEFLEELCAQYRKNKTDFQWQKKALEGRELAAEQFESISRIMDGLEEEFVSSVEFDTNIEKQLVVALGHGGLKGCDATVVKNRYGRYEAAIRYKKNGGQKDAPAAAAKAATAVIGRPMWAREQTEGPEGGRAEVYLVEKERYSVACAAVNKIKAGQTQSGDSFNYMPIGDGKFIMVISDGMGSGKQAASQSGITVTMLEQLLAAGFDKKSAMKIINSALLIRSDAECFATVDMAIVDLFDAQAEFVKIGASPTYIKRGKSVSRIKSATLPAGILRDVDMETSCCRLAHGDYIVMISDGVQDLSDEWLEEMIGGTGSISPQAMARQVMDETIRRKNGAVDDDMTVLAAKILEI